MVLVVILIAAGITTFSHAAPFPFLLDLANSDVSIWRIPHRGQKTIYLTFDDGPNPRVTPQLLDLLRQKGIHATFFLIDEHLNEATAPIVARMFEEGHSVAQHSGNRWLLLRSPDAFSAELRAAADRMQLLTGHRRCQLFRPHAGWRSIKMIRGLRQSGYKLVGWSWMTWDWIWFRKRTGPRVAAHLISHAAPGKIIIIHDGHHRDPSADRQYAIEATARVVDSLLAQQYEFRTLCDVLDDHWTSYGVTPQRKD
jgi:peptidoglycan/xylan/chitin deacetylase (PgdA/CDA1 family)